MTPPTGPNVTQANTQLLQVLLHDGTLQFLVRLDTTNPGLWKNGNTQEFSSGYNQDFADTHIDYYMFLELMMVLYMTQTENMVFNPLDVTIVL